MVPSKQIASIKDRLIHTGKRPAYSKVPMSGRRLILDSKLERQLSLFMGYDQRVYPETK